MFLLKYLKSEWVNEILISTAKMIDAEVLFRILGKTFIYKRKCRGPKIESCGTLCLTLAQSETLLLFSLPLYVGNSISKLQIQVTIYVFEVSAGNCHR